MTVPPTVVLVDDSEDLRTVVRMHFDRAPDFEVLGEGGSGYDAIELARLHHPDVMVLDVSMPGMDGLEALPQVLGVSPRTKVVMFTGFAQQGLAERAHELGAAALLEKSLPLRQLPAAIGRLLEPGGAAAEPEPAGPELTAEHESSVVEEQQERFREVFEEAAIGMGTMTLAGHLVRANKTMSVLAERSASELVGLEYDQLLAPGVRQRFRDLMELATGAGESADPGVFQFEHELSGVVGRRVRTTLAPIRDSRGAALYLFVQVQDVTEQRRIEAALRRSEDRFRMLVDTVEDAITMLDPDGLVQSWNPGAERMNGYLADEIIGRPFSTFYPEELRALAHPEHMLRLALRDGHYEEEGWRVRKNGERFWANVVITAIRDDEGNHVGFAKVARDVSERRRLWVEQEAAGDALGRANAELQAANAGLSQSAADQAQFLAVTAHELRTPVAVLADLAETLREEITDPAQTPMLNMMVASSARLQRLLDDLLTAARLDARAMTLQRRLVDLGQAVAHSVDAAIRRYPDKTIKYDGAGGGDLIEADPERLGQIIDNLVNNALNHGSPPVRVSVVPAGERMEVRVVDSGSGVPHEVRDKLFDRYVTAARSGTGLGLYIVRELARAHGGDAWHEADLPNPTFVVSLPRVDSTRRAASAPADAHHARSGHLVPDGPG